MLVDGCILMICKRQAGGSDLCSYTVLLHQGLLSKVDLQGIICAQADIHSPGKEGGEGITVVVQEQAVVGQGAHTQPDLHQDKIGRRVLLASQKEQEENFEMV